MMAERTAGFRFVGLPILVPLRRARSRPVLALSRNRARSQLIRAAKIAHACWPPGLDVSIPSWWEYTRIPRVSNSLMVATTSRRESPRCGRDGIATRSNSLEGVQYCSFRADYVRAGLVVDLRALR